MPEEMQSDGDLIAEILATIGDDLVDMEVHAHDVFGAPHRCLTNAEALTRAIPGALLVLGEFFTDDSSGGWWPHAWVQLPDGRYVDPTPLTVTYHELCIYRGVVFGPPQRARLRQSQQRT